MSGEELLLEQAIKGNQSAFEELVASYEKKIYNYCYRMTNNREDAEDLAQEVFVRVYKSLESFQGKSRFSTWIYKVAHNICIDEHRRKKTVSIPLNKGEEDVKGFDLPSNSPSPEDLILTMEQKEYLQACISRLKPEYKSVIILRDIQGYTYGEIANILEIPIGTVKSHISRARSALREELRHKSEGVASYEM